MGNPQAANQNQVVQYAQVPTQPQQVVLVQQQQQLATPGKFKAVSCLAQCPSCQKVVQTRLSYTSGLGAWLVCGGFICAGCFCGCCFIPFCMQSMKDVNHHCPDCSKLLGVKKFI